ncbi:hypothetical protein GKZ90_0007790 [Flavobacterium sp. MC2016-06]|uniref:hypothetical protein n=1 Tax=Flavobacterium sp. MC2016-06 TaxID=2676308 RepID=UPI0012BA91DE|nr:hypothetical protein [Flavobacterium sp. MC2016-06]MBU3858069.1 hypothetical protein [Flavobacterium sp. MC2016-06]
MTGYRAKEIIVFLVMGILFFFFIQKGKDREEYKKRLKEEGIALATRVEESGEDRVLKYYFYSNKRIISEINTASYEGNEYKLINKFFKVKYNLDKPEENEIFLEEELNPDSTSLVKAGFTKTKYYIYDAGVTCKYIEHLKWK